MQGSEALTAALGMVVRLDAAERLQLRQILAMAPELAESARYMRNAPPILKSTVEDMRTAMIADLCDQWSMSEEEVMALIEAMTPVPEVEVADTNPLDDYLASWRLPMTGIEAAERMLAEHYALGWTPALISANIRKFHHATVSEASLGVADGRVKIKARSVEVVIKVLSQAGPFNPDFTTELDVSTIRRIMFRSDVTPVSPRDMGKVGAQALADAFQEVAGNSKPKALFTLAEVVEASDLAELNQMRPLFSQVADFMVRHDVQEGLNGVMAELNALYGVQGEEAVDRALYRLGYRGKPLRYVIPFTGQAEAALIELRSVLLLALENSTLPQEEQHLLTAVRENINYALQVNDDLRRGIMPLGPLVPV